MLVACLKAKKKDVARSKSDRSVEDSSAPMGMGCTREFERVSAATGMLSEVSTQFEPCLDVPNGGVLWAIPALLENGLLRYAQIDFSLPDGYYGCKHIFLLLATMALARVKNIEQLRYHPAGEWGKLTGLDRIPEVKTLREKISILAQPEQVSRWSNRLSQDWMEAAPQSAGVLYVDGHVRTYHGKQTKLPRRYVSRQRLCLRGTTDYWVNDQLGRPFFVLNMPVDPGLLQVLKEKVVPRLIAEVPGQPSNEQLENDPFCHRFMVIFDREGYSPNFFKFLWKNRIACQTYHKYPAGDWPESQFSEQIVHLSQSETVAINLAERGLLLSNGMWVREIRKLTTSGHQTSVLSTDYISDAGVIAFHMFSRWSQENFFCYMMEHFGLNKLVSYKIEPVDETTTVVNPDWRCIDGLVRKKAAVLGRKKNEIGALCIQDGQTKIECAEYDKQMGELKLEVALLQKETNKLKASRKEIKKHIPFGQLSKEEQFYQLSPTRKHFIDMIKMIAYRAETAMAILLHDVISRPDDARSLLRELFSTETDLIPDTDKGTLTVCLHHLTNRMSDKAIEFLADILNKSETVYPGTNLQMIFKLVSKPNP